MNKKRSNSNIIKSNENKYTKQDQYVEMLLDLKLQFKQSCLDLAVKVDLSNGEGNADHILENAKKFYSFVRN